jgi:hypothetical protein
MTRSRITPIPVAWRRWPLRTASGDVIDGGAVAIVAIHKWASTPG